MGEPMTDPIRGGVARHNVHCPCHSETAELKAALKEVGEALEPLCRFMLTAEPGEYVRDSVNAEIHWHDTERAREALTRIKQLGGWE